MAADAGSHASGLKKAAILLVLLGEDVASEICKHLPPGKVESITQEIATLPHVSSENALEVLEEFHRLVMAGDSVSQGGTDYANKILVKAFGKEGAEELLQQVAQAAQLNGSKLDSLGKVDPQQLAKFIENEHPQTIALVLAHLESKQASTVLMKLPPESRAEP